jgi:FlaA1/EpsC-like NDP-sugar epimerase
MTIPEASRLELQAAAMGKSGQVLVLDMGEPVRVVDLARQLLRLSGHMPEDIPIVFSGLRPGEKMYEELLADTDATVATSVPAMRVALLPAQAHLPVTLLHLATSMPAEGQSAESWEALIRAELKRWVPEYQQQVSH